MARQWGTQAEVLDKRKNNAAPGRRRNTYKLSSYTYVRISIAQRGSYGLWQRTSIFKRRPKGPGNNMHATTSTGPGPVEVLLGLMGPRSLALARSFAEAGYTPILAFTSAQLEASAASADVILADTVVDPGAVALRSAGGNATVRLFVGEAAEAPLADVHSFVTPDTSDQDIVAHTSALIALRGRETVPDDPCWGPLRLDPPRREATWQGRSIELTATQFDILEVLVRARGAVVTKEALQRAVWPSSEPDDGARLLAHIRRIRRIFEDEPSHPQFLLTTRGIGFRLGGVRERGAPVMRLADPA